MGKIQNTLFLDGLRGLAAFYVMVGHARWLLWEGYTEGYLLHPENYSWAGKLLVYFFSLFRYGHEAVLLFFVLSGFVIHLRYAKAVANQGVGASMDMGDFFMRRLKRIMPPLLVAVALTYLFDRIGSFFGFSIYEQATVYDTINRNVLDDHSFSTLLGNLFFLMDFYVPVFGSNGPLWSLAYEWWFYVLYPLFFLINKRSPLGAFVLVLLLFALVLIIPVDVLILRKVFSYFPVWWLGVILADIYAGRGRLSFSHLAPFSLLLMVMPFVLHLPNQILLFPALMWGLGFTGLFACLFHLQQKGYSINILNWLKPMGDISYSLYVTHMPLMVLMSGWLFSKSSNGYLPQSFIYLVVAMSISLLLAWGCWYVAERPFVKKRR